MVGIEAALDFLVDREPGESDTVAVAEAKASDRLARIMAGLPERYRPLAAGTAASVSRFRSADSSTRSVAA